MLHDHYRLYPWLHLILKLDPSVRQHVMILMEVGIPFLVASIGGYLIPSLYSTFSPLVSELLNQSVKYLGGSNVQLLFGHVKET